MKDKRVREAFNLAVNKDEMLKTVQAGFGKVAAGQLIEPGILGHRADITAVPYDPERAKSLLKDAGYNGEQILLTSTVATRPYTEAVVGYLTAAGVKAQVDQVDLALVAKALNGGSDRPMIGWSSDYFQLRDFDAVGPRFTQSWPSHFFDNEEYTKLFADSRKELDEQKRTQMIGKMLEIMRNEFATLWLMWRDLPTVYTKRSPSSIVSTMAPTTCGRSRRKPSLPRAHSNIDSLTLRFGGTAMRYLEAGNEEAQRRCGTTVAGRTDDPASVYSGWGAHGWHVTGCL